MTTASFHSCWRRHTLPEKRGVIAVSAGELLSQPTLCVVAILLFLLATALIERVGNRVNVLRPVNNKKKETGMTDISCAERRRRTKQPEENLSSCRYHLISLAELKE